MTMRDVADAAGVGVATVSRVVNGLDTVNESTAERVRQAIDELGFRRDEIARSLRPGQNSMTLGLMLGDLTNPFWSGLAKAAVQQARAAGYAVLVTTADEDPEAERRSVDELISRRVAGLIVAPGCGDHSFLRDGRGEPRLPVVFVDRPPRGVQADVLVFDNDGGGRIATRHLIEHGHRRIGAIVAGSFYTTGRRLRGYRRALRDAGLPIEDSLIAQLEHGTVADGFAATAELLNRPDPPTAIFSTTSFLTEGVLAALGPRHDQIAVVGFDDFRLASQLPTPVTVVAIDTESLGRQAAEMLLERIDGSTAAVRRVKLPVTLIPRGSGELPAPRESSSAGRTSPLAGKPGASRDLATARDPATARIRPTTDRRQPARLS